MSWPTVYRGLTAAAVPLVARYLARRVRRGREDAERLPERLGFPGLPRPLAPLVWVNAASVGEAQSVLALIGRIRIERPLIKVLLTTGTVAAAHLLRDRLPEGVRHQFVPVDAPQAVERFLDHWRPDLAIWVESELWPNLVLATHRRSIPLLLTNARLSDRSLRRWRGFPGLIRPILKSFSLCLAQDEAQAERFRSLGADRVASVGDLKTVAAPLAADPAVLAGLREAVAGRPVWLAASTHANEEEVAAAVHRIVARQFPALLTVIVPRHPVRGPAIEAMLRGRGFSVARRGAGETLAGDSDIYLADTLGELGLFFRLAGVAFIGGSLAHKGGHNPFEAARLDCAIAHGPDMSNCAAMAQALADAGAARLVRDVESLAAMVTQFLGDPEERDAAAAAAARVAAAHGGALDAVLAAIAPWLDRLAPLAAADAAQPRRQMAGRADARA